MNAPVQIIKWIYNLCLNLYPRDFQSEFGAEMRAVFAEAIRDSHKHHPVLLLLRELRDFPVSWLNSWFADQLRGGYMSPQNEHVKPSTRWQALLGVLPFLAFGIAKMIGKADSIYQMNAHDAEMAVYLLALTGLLVGSIRGFPMWSYSFLGWAVWIAWFNTNVSIDGTNWGYRVWVPFGIMLLIALVWIRSLDSIKKLFHDIWYDWTRLSVVMFAFGGLVNMIYDENHHPYLLLFMLASTLVAGAGAWFFLRSGSVQARVLSITGGFILPAIISGISYATWDWAAYYGLPKPDEAWYEALGGSITMITFWLIILLWPVIIDITHRIIRKQQAA